MSKKKENNVPADKLALYDRLVAAYPDIDRKGATLPYTSHNGHMFSFLSPAGTLGLRLPKEEREKFLQAFKTVLMEAHGAVIKEYAAVPDSLLSNTEKLKAYFELSYEYVKTLKSKPTMKTK